MLLAPGYTVKVPPKAPSLRSEGLCRVVAPLLAAMATFGLACYGARADEPLQYNRDVRPILVDACFACHGPDSASRQAGLRIDRREDAVDGAAIVPGEPDASELIRRVLSEDHSALMPPPESKKRLTDAQKQTLVRWVAQGAPYQPHWSLIAPQRPEPPAVERQGWARNEIDRFVLARLEAEGMAPAPEADRRTLARRACLDATGLPPTPEQIEAFLADDAPDAYERYLDRLLDSPRWGEHRARYWLDAARYGDTHGVHFDNYREMWSYRDWVIAAFNQNMPFDRFTIESLAGDLLPDAGLEQRIASGFNRCNITTNEGGIIDEEYRVLYTRDRTDTTALVWMGMTAGCAVCHDHKFDPLSQKEFYELSAFFNNTTQAAKDGNVKDTPPIVAVPLQKDAPRWKALRTEVPAAEHAAAARREAARPEFDQWLAGANDQDLADWIPTRGLQLLAPLTGGGDELSYTLTGKPATAPRPATVEWRPGKTASKAAYLNQGVALEVAGAGDFERDQAFSAAVWVKLANNDSSGALMARMDDADGHGYRGWDMWFEGRRIGSHLIHNWPDDAVKVVTRDPLPADEWVHVVVTHDGTGKAGGVKVYVNGKSQPVSVQADKLKGTTRTKVPYKIGQRDRGSVLSGVAVEDARVYDRALSESEASGLANATAFAAVIAAQAPDRAAADPDRVTADPVRAAADPVRAAADINALYGWWLTNLDDQGKQLAAAHDALAREQADIQARGTIAHVMQERPEPAKAYVLDRGEYDQRLEEVGPDTPAFLPPFPEELPRNRLGLAKWLVRADHPLTARVTVNRFWQEAFGQGLVRTAGDFGVPGDLPSHPELLDWLAVDFRESGWDIKRLFKQVLSSATYRQSARASAADHARDPDNRLLARGPRFRMDAEMVRDYALAASGLLSDQIGGPSVRPYQPSGVWEAVAMGGSNTRNYQQDAGDALYRRSMYTFWKRAAPPASMDIFNAPSRENCVVVRERTNTPLQALVTLNDPQFVEAARVLATRALKQAPPSFHHRLSYIATRVLAREASGQEKAILQQSLDDLASFYAAHTQEAQQLIEVGESPVDASVAQAELASWTMLANELMNLDEALNK
ncbi:Planctomycete cytochrome C [Pirellulimonas nuda]|uniref:Planctomycete cytochrome C n=1 Tax=Pirellulimonas nuda TaxID=2528009 RepID=A0A518DHQ3_9BACT|nr:DUF1553 domain-containing protein [Pirellulimonas nuda]QDU90996.1 Planctomycete cytochrome C [Pirellulimonas nuda]